MLQWLYTYVASVFSKCFSCFQTLMLLQVFHLDVAKVDLNVAKVDLNVAYVAMTIQICFKCILHMLQGQDKFLQRR